VRRRTLQSISGVAEDFAELSATGGIDESREFYWF
jgi:hypothetical protein